LNAPIFRYERFQHEWHQRSRLHRIAVKLTVQSGIPIQLCRQIDSLSWHHRA
jgi:hypothetical protein